MNNVYMHINKDKNSFITKIIYLLIPFFLYGFYKNGLKLYNLQLINLYSLFKPLILVLIAIIVSIVTSLAFKKDIIDFKFISNLLVSLIVMPKINIILYTVVLIILNVLYHFIKFNLSCVYMIVISVTLILLNKYTYLNIYEASNNFHFSFFDYLIGKSSGGIGNTFLLMSIISFIVLLFSICYKKTIFITSIISFYILYIIYSFLSGEPNMAIYASPTLLFSFIFIAPISIHSPYTKAGSIIYGIILSILSFVFSFWNFELGIYISIFIVSLLSTFLDRIFTKNNNKQLIETL